MRGSCTFTASFDMKCPLCGTDVPGGQLHECEVRSIDEPDPVETPAAAKSVPVKKRKGERRLL